MNTGMISEEKPADAVRSFGRGEAEAEARAVVEKYIERGPFLLALFGPGGTHLLNSGVEVGDFQRFRVALGGLLYRETEHRTKSPAAPDEAMRIAPPPPPAEGNGTAAPNAPPIPAPEPVAAPTYPPIAGAPASDVEKPEHMDIRDYGQPKLAKDIRDYGQPQSTK